MIEPIAPQPRKQEKNYIIRKVSDVHNNIILNITSDHHAYIYFPKPSLRSSRINLDRSIARFYTIGSLAKAVGDAWYCPETPEVSVEKAIAAYTSSYAQSRAQIVQEAHVVASPFSVATGELTATLKAKWSVIVDKCFKEINTMYSDGALKLVGYSSMNIDRPYLS
jgi:hypothetical protein